MTNAALRPDIARVLGPDGIVQRVRLAAYAWCEQDGAVLLTRIAANGPGGGLWTLPGGGLDFGEDPLDGVIREVAEETGLAVEPGELLGVRSAMLEPAETITGHRIHAVGILYRGRITGGELRNEADGSSDLARWVPADEVAVLPQVDLLRWATDLVRGA
jgi:ADP-ribose pyrophosphatase YjhB (NUDIX family)